MPCKSDHGGLTTNCCFHTLTNKNKLRTVLSDAEQEALYSLPDFDDAQRLEYLALFMAAP
ncbi:MAG: hypothetical protein ABI171_12960 [Collimonas sp.]|uniref:hypothetical protein n=1 Tax=Collimonas sp. TaxID=1963772 RepID=UPI0032646F8B